LKAAPSAPGRLLVYCVAFATGAIVMSFEMLGSRYLNPFFGSGVFTWASLISTVLAALMSGYFLGGRLADAFPRASVLAVTVVLGSAYLVVLPGFADGVLQAVLASIDDVKLGSLVASFAIVFPPVVLLGMYSPFAIRLLLDDAARSGSVSGAVYGISTLGSIVGTLVTTFYLMPLAGSRHLTIALGVAGMAAGALLLLVRPKKAIAAAAVLVLAAAVLPLDARAAVLDEKVRSAVLAKPDGQLASIETLYNNIVVSKRQSYVSMSFQRRGESYTESSANLADPDELPLRYTRLMTLGVAYPPEVRRCLLIGLGGGSLSTYLGRYLPEAQLDNVELDPGVIAAAKRYFALQETPKIRFIESDGRLFLYRSPSRYDLVLVDAFRGGYVPFHLLTKEFYSLLRQRLTPSGVAVLNIHGGTKLFPSTLLTLRSVFPRVDLFAVDGNIVAVAGNDDAGRESLPQRAAAAQKKLGLRYSLVELLRSRVQWPEDSTARLLTDDFAPVELYDAIKQANKRQW
jgi:spermidine synthase